jgi:peptidoglycan/xylan/chitin deacetylase (PgdA/CDA1 family)
MLRGWAKELYFGLDAGAPRLASGSATAFILAFHSVNDPDAIGDLISPAIVVRPRAFRAIITMLRNRFDVIPLDEIPARLGRRDARPPRPKPALALTLDDGYKDNREFAFPILHAAGLTATVFLTTGAIDRPSSFWVARLRYGFHHTRLSSFTRNGERPALPLRSLGERVAAANAILQELLPLGSEAREEALDRIERDLGVTPDGRVAKLMLSWDDVREMRRGGIRFGSHTVSHPNATLASDTELARELRESRSRIETEIGEPVETFCYPNTGGILPNHDARTRAALADAGYRVAVTSRYGAPDPRSDPLGLPRVAVGRSTPRPAAVYVKIVHAAGVGATG